MTHDITPGLIERLEAYPVEDLQEIISRASTRLELPIRKDAANLIAQHSRGVPRHALRIQRRIRDLAQVREMAEIDNEVVIEGLQRLRIDALGLEEMDRKILRALTTHVEPVGLKTLAAMVDESEDTLEDVFEPHLIRSGLLMRTPRGRAATAKAYAHLDLPDPGGEGESSQPASELPF